MGNNAFQSWEFIPIRAQRVTLCRRRKATVTAQPNAEPPTHAAAHNAIKMLV